MTRAMSVRGENFTISVIMRRASGLVELLERSVRQRLPKSSRQDREP